MAQHDATPIAFLLHAAKLLGGFLVALRCRPQAFVPVATICGRAASDHAPHDLTTTEGRFVSISSGDHQSPLAW